MYKINNQYKSFFLFPSDFIFIKCFSFFSPLFFFSLKNVVDTGEPLAGELDLLVWLHPALLIKVTQVWVKGFLTGVGF